eukprot:g2647.t1
MSKRTARTKSPISPKKPGGRKTLVESIKREEKKGQNTAAQEKDDDLAVKPVNPYIDFVLGLAFIILCFNLVRILSNKTDYYMLGFFAVSLVVVAFGTRCVAFCSKHFALFISNCRTGKNIPKDCRNPMKSKLALRKFSDQAWQLTIHTTMTMFEVYLLFVYKDENNHTSEQWWSDPVTCTRPCPVEYAEGRLSRPMILNKFYLFQLAIWVYTGFSCKWIEARRKDYLQMMTHHVITIMLVIFSFASENQPIGLVILFVHDFSDIFLDLMKMCNYLKLEGTHGMFIVETVFAINTFITWPYLRLYYFPVYVIYNGTAKGYLNNCGGGNEANSLLRQIELCRGLDFCTGGNTLLVLLACLHWFWYFLMLRILYKLLTGKSGNLNRAGKEVYEGESD